MKKTMSIRAKRLITSAMSAITCLTIISSTAFAETVRDASNLLSATNATPIETVDNEKYITVDDCCVAGKKWIIANYPEGTEIKNIIPIQDLDNRLVGYCINFSTNGFDAGYLVLNADKYAESYVKEFALDGSGIFDTLVEKIPSKGRTSTVTAPVIYSTNPYQYAIKYSQGNKELFYNSDCRVMDYASEIEIYEQGDSLNYVELSQQSDDGQSKEEYYKSFFNESDLTAYSWSEDKSIPYAEYFIPFTMGALVDGSNKGNCGPTAAMNICKYYKEKRSKTNMYLNDSVTDTYSALVDAVEFDRNGKDGTYYDKLQSGLKSYINGRGYTAKIGDYWFDWWSDFKRDFDGGYPNLIFIQGNKYDTTTKSWITVGHFVVGIGYRVSSDGEQYVRVCDGWYTSNERYVLFKSDSISKFLGTVVDVS